MIKKDSSIHQVCIASIRRHTMKPFNYKWTRFYETNLEFENINYGLIEKLETEELVICSTIVDKENCSVLTTRRLITRENKQMIEGDIGTAKYKSYGKFKGAKNLEITFGEIYLEEGREMKYFIETGKASMVMIYGVKTRIEIGSKSIEDNEKTIERWRKRDDLD
jgi:hypothetical protein